MLSGIADDRDENETNKGLADVSTLDNVVNAADKVLGANGNKDGDDDEDDTSSNSAHVRLFLLLFSLGLILGIEKVAVRAKLEEEVHDVEDEQDDGGAARKGEDALGLVLGAVLVENSVQLGKEGQL